MRLGKPWVIVAVVIVFALFGFFAWRQLGNVDNDRDAHALATEQVRNVLTGPPIEFAPLGDPRVRIVRSREGYEVYGVMRTTHSRMKRATARSRDGWVLYSVGFRHEFWGPFRRETWSNYVSFDDHVRPPLERRAPPP